VIALFLDDTRNPPDGVWTIARTSAAAIAVLAGGDVGYMSLDHDLGGDDTGMRVVDWLDERIAAGDGFALPVWRIHSANPVGAARLRAALESIERRMDEAAAG
jgi:hypothetical protein